MKPHRLSLGVGSAVLAFDVGATDLKAALVDDAGSIRDIVRVPRRSTAISPPAPW